MRKIPLVNGEIYHIYTKSIAGFKIFRNKSEYERMRKLFSHYRVDKPLLRFSNFLGIKNKKAFFQKHFSSKKYLVKIVAYCIMPTHIHLILKQVKKNGISIFMQNILNSYSRYFNLKNKRKGPLWESRFENKLIDRDEYLLHLSRYIHLNPVSKELVDRPEDWKYSSYRQYLGLIDDSRDWVSSFFDYTDMDSCSYREFVEDNIDYQRSLEKIKNLILE
ncbi:MAG: transposase [Candidatus Omnitrophica bacterium]|nr:transposase [Candidatus Omnitrophota bacterium]MCF7888214.1 transposase [Candidatus Omnitrophota bacterium]